MISSAARTAVGSYVAATGAVITARILSEMEREDHKLGLVTLCIGGGQGIAMLSGEIEWRRTPGVVSVGSGQQRLAVREGEING